MILIAPSILASDFSRLGEEVIAMAAAGADMIHLDVMDGHFVPNLSFGPPVIAKIRGISSIFFDAHLMISNPLEYIPAFAKAGCNGITFHAESESDILATIKTIHAHGMKAGISLKPATPVSAIAPFLPFLDLVLVMTVEPGFGGQSFMPAMLDKISELKTVQTKENLAFTIQVDGGIDTQTAPLVVRAGANILVAGMALFSAPDYAKAIEHLLGAAKQGLI